MSYDLVVAMEWSWMERVGPVSGPMWGPCRETEADLVLRSLERAEDMDRSTLRAGVRWRWETFPEFLDVVDALPKGINYSAYVGHSAIRAYVMGERAFVDPASEDDLRAMVAVLDDSLDAGAIGFSTSRSPAHLMVDDQPVASRLATWEELRQLVDVMTRKDAGIHRRHHRPTSPRSSTPPTPPTCSATGCDAGRS
jgi:N-acyl-D-aspartate/D-glutamate deacylase